MELCSILREFRLLPDSVRKGYLSPTIRVAALLTLRMFNFGRPKTAGDWIVHIAGAIVAMLLIWWMLRMYVL